MQEMFWLTEKIAAAVCLAVMSIQDIRQKKVSVWLILLLGAIGILFAIADLSGVAGAQNNMAGSSPFWQLCLPGMVPGIVLCIISRLSGNRIGSGDGYVIMALGIHRGLWDILSCLLYGTVFCGLAGMLLLVMKRRRKEDTLPFLPFLTTGYVITILL